MGYIPQVVPDIFPADLKIMCVDDDPEQILIYQRIFCKLQAVCHLFDVSEQAIASAEKIDYDIIVTDLNMPLYNGVDVYQHTIAFYRKKGSKLPKYILVTGHSDQILQAVDSKSKDLFRIYGAVGFDAYFTKPIDYSTFFESALYLLTTEINKV
jgi:CheY-like chemotaxis protein